MDTKICSICGEENEEYFQTLKCGHTFHYQCLYLSFLNMKNNNCPYCRATGNKLPIVNGVKKITPWIHNCNTIDGDVLNYKPKKCKMVLSRGKNKGKQCTRNCKLGYEYCSQHFKMMKNKSKEIEINGNSSNT